jgi:hypothetical protein
LVEISPIVPTKSSAPDAILIIPPALFFKNEPTPAFLTTGLFYAITSALNASAALVTPSVLLEC